MSVCIADIVFHDSVHEMFQICSVNHSKSLVFSLISSKLSNFTLIFLSMQFFLQIPEPPQCLFTQQALLFAILFMNCCESYSIGSWITCFASHLAHRSDILWGFCGCTFFTWITGHMFYITTWLTDQIYHRYFICVISFKVFRCCIFHFYLMNWCVLKQLI